ncbi:MAG: nitroreductase family protein, partial [Spirochaetota bacterium]
MLGQGETPPTSPLLPEIARRKSIRKYLPTSVPKDVVERILEAGRRAPSAKNRQAWRFIAIQDADLRAKVEEAAFGQEYVGEAPLILALCTTNVEYKMPNGIASHTVDLSIAGAFMVLQAVHEGLGTCIVTTFREEEVKSLLTVPYSMRIVMLITV